MCLGSNLFCHSWGVFPDGPRVYCCCCCCCCCCLAVSAGRGVLPDGPRVYCCCCCCLAVSAGRGVLPDGPRVCAAVLWVLHHAGSMAHQTHRELQPGRELYLVSNCVHYIIFTQSYIIGLRFDQTFCPSITWCTFVMS